MVDAPEGFRLVESPDLERVSALIRRTWERPRWDYDRGLLELHLLRPGGDPRLAVGFETEGGELATYEALIPFEVELFGARRRAVFASFFTVAPEYQGRGLSILQQEMLIRRALDEGYDLYLVVCEDGALSNRAVESVFSKLRIPVGLVRRILYLAAAAVLVHPRLPSTHSGCTRLYTPADRARLLPVVEAMGRGADLRKRIPELDLDFVFTARPHARSWVFEGARKLRALANVLRLDVLSQGGGRASNVYFENVGFGDLSADEQALFLADVLQDLDAEGFHAAFLPDLGYVPTEAFASFGFRRAPRKLNLYLAPLRPHAVPGGIRPLDTLHLDVY